jgi:hypothetical protein
MSIILPHLIEWESVDVKKMRFASTSLGGKELQGDLLQLPWGGKERQGGQFRR